VATRAQEILETHEKYLAARRRAERGEVGWDALGDYFTEDAVFVDPAWGRVEGRDAILRFLRESMAGLEGWTFPQEWQMVEGDRLVTRWMNRLPGRRADGSFYEAPGISVLTYAEGGRFSREEDLLNMVHVVEVIRESGWRPGPGFNPPPRTPDRGR
jgi:ketosteroid isomerase-like protein